jgi:hypothetical protein
MTQLALAFPPTSPHIDDHEPTFMAENTTTLLAIAAQTNRRTRGRRQALTVLRWRIATGGKGTRPTKAQAAQLETLDPSRTGAPTP